MRFALSFLALPAFAAAQPFTIADGNVTYSNSMTSIVGDPTGLFDVSSCTTDHLWGNHWCFSIAGSNFGQTFDDAGNGSYGRRPAPGAMSQILLDVARLGLLDATINDTVTSTGPESGRLDSTLTVTNRSLSPVTVKIYHFVDIDFNATNAVDYTLPGSNANRFVIGDDEPCNGCIVFEATTTADHYECGNWVTGGGPAGLAISAGADLNDTGLPFALPDDDWCGAFQWTRTLNPGATDTFSITMDCPTRGAPGTNTNVGVAVGGAGGAPTLTSTTLPRTGRTFTLDVGNAGSATVGAILFGIDPAPTQIAVLGLQVIDPASGIFAAAGVPLSGGAGSLSLAIACDLGPVAGSSFCSQVFMMDATSPAAIPLVHSDLLVSTIGD